jgi:hypothetical protein
LNPASPFHQRAVNVVAFNGPGMTKTPDQMRQQAQEYRNLHNYMSGAVLTDAIEQVALALERAASELEAELARMRG